MLRDSKCVRIVCGSVITDLGLLSAAHQTRFQWRRKTWKRMELSPSMCFLALHLATIASICLGIYPIRFVRNNSPQPHLEHIKKSEDTEAFPAFFLNFLSPLLPCLAELSAESSQNKTVASSLLLYVL